MQDPTTKDRKTYSSDYLHFVSTGHTVALEKMMVADTRGFFIYGPHGGPVWAQIQEWKTRQSGPLTHRRPRDPRVQLTHPRRGRTGGKWEKTEESRCQVSSRGRKTRGRVVEFGDGETLLIEGR